MWEHLVFFAKMIFEDKVVKFHLVQANEQAVHVVHMTQKHGEDIIQNYNDLKSHLDTAHAENRFSNISIVGVCIATSEYRGWL